MAVTETYLEEDSSVVMTCEAEYWNECDSSRIFIDDPYTLKIVEPQTIITINFGTIQLICTEVINEKNIMCKVISGGVLGNGQFVCMRNTRYMRPPLSKHDRQLIAFVKEYEVCFTVFNLNSHKL
jgi:pyruvate kinase